MVRRAVETGKVTDAESILRRSMAELMLLAATHGQSSVVQLLVGFGALTASVSFINILPSQPTCVRSYDHLLPLTRHAGLKGTVRRCMLRLLAATPQPCECC